MKLRIIKRISFQIKISNVMKTLKIILKMGPSKSMDIMKLLFKSIRILRKAYTIPTITSLLKVLLNSPLKATLKKFSIRWHRMVKLSSPKMLSRINGHKKCIKRSSNRDLIQFKKRNFNTIKMISLPRKIKKLRI